MIVKLPDNAIYRITHPDAEEALYAMGVGVDAIEDGRPKALYLHEVASDEWQLGVLGDREKWFTKEMGACVTSGTVDKLVGYVLPAAIEGREVSRHVVMRDAEGPVEPYQDLGAVRAKYGEVVVGHQWGDEDERGYRECCRCKDRKHRSYDERDW